ncbi:MAG: CBS domain-containing protein [Desulfovibrio sp.]|nr:CBS domain-containing protein [Desulfovibrio sp.]
MLDFSWVTHLSAWAGLGTLVLLEVVLGVDNLVFISILVGRLPGDRKRQAFLVGLGLALLMRIVLLTVMARLATLTTPLFELGGHGFSARDLILMAGGVFLLLKGTMELHDRLEGHSGRYAGETEHHAGFWQVIFQVVVLDAVFSLDSIITAVGMVDHVSIMMLAVVFAMAIMVMAAGPLLAFMERHPTIIVLCLGFLLMIGLSLLADGLGFHIPKGYMYAAIVFSLMVEMCNQWALRNRRRRFSMRDMRESTARVILNILGGSAPGQGDTQLDAAALAGETKELLFAPEERAMLARVIRLGGRTARFIMVPRQRVGWIDSNADRDTVSQQAAASRLAWLPVLRRDTDEVLGVVHPGDILLRQDEHPSDKWDLKNFIRPAPTIFEHTPLPVIMEDFRTHPTPLAFVRDEYGSVVGVITPAELLSVLAGQMGDMPAGPEA